MKSAASSKRVEEKKQQSAPPLIVPDVKIKDVKALVHVWKNLMKTGHFSDVTFVLGPKQKEYKCHRLVFSAWSVAFRDLLEDAQEDRVLLPKVDSSTFKVIRNYMYTGTLEFHFDHLFGLIDFARQYKVDGVEALCLKYFSEKLSLNHIWTFLTQTKNRNLADLYQQCISYAEAHFGELELQSDAFGAVPQPVIKHFLSTNKMQVPEDYLFEFLLAWVRKQPASTCDQHLTELLPVLRFSQLSLNLFYSKIKTEPLLQMHVGALKETFRKRVASKEATREEMQLAEALRKKEEEELARKRAEAEAADRSERSEEITDESSAKDDYEDIRTGRYSVL